jgi:hypothetical protein
LESTTAANQWGAAMIATLFDAMRRPRTATNIITIAVLANTFRNAAIGSLAILE